MACGSGAFLVQACRYLSERLVEAWEEIESKQPGVLRITPEGAPATGELGEALIPSETNERISYAQRIIAQRCLYGVDKNPLAVEMAKLSLWLLTLAKDKPFTFLDHAIRCGDSLVGIHDIDQIRYFTFDLDDQQKSGFTGAVEKAVNEVSALRKRIGDRPAEQVEDAEVQHSLLGEAESKSARLRYAADLLTAIELRSGNEQQKRDWQNDAAIQASYYVEKEEIEKFREAAKKAMNGQMTLHWPLEFPEVFVERGGFDAFVCNPPFLGGQKITGNLGISYRNFLVDHLARGKRGSADLCAYFFLRAKWLLRTGGSFGMLATNTIAQGDTREVGLDQIAEAGGVIYRSVPSRPWPGDASLEVAEVWVRNGGSRANYFLDDQEVIGITPFLTTLGRTTGNPYRLVANASKSFIGSYVLGMGFVLSPEEAQALIAKDKRNRDVLSPYLNGEDLNSRPDQSASRWVINFRDWPLDRSGKGTWHGTDKKAITLWLRSGHVPKDYPGPVAADYPDCMTIVREKVKPEREALAQGNETARDHARRWWQFARATMLLYATIIEMERVLAVALVTHHVAFNFVRASQVFAHRLAVFPFDQSSSLAIVQSSFHEPWARSYSSSLETRINYSPSDCFETFPFPEGEGPLREIGERYHAHRQSLMLTRGEGLTKVYNRFHDADEASGDICLLRDLHKNMDEAVRHAYGWEDLKLDHDFHDTKQGVRFTISEAARREVLDRLLELNHQRYAEEVAAGLHEKSARKRVKASPAKKNVRPNSSPSATPLPFAEVEDLAAPESAHLSAERCQSRSFGTAQCGRDYERPIRADELETNRVMAAFRQALRSLGWTTREQLLKEVSVALGYERLRAETEEILRNHLRSAIRRKIVCADGADAVGPETQSMEDYTLEELREVFGSVMRLARSYEREEVMRAVAEHLGFTRLTETVRQSLKSAVNSGIRQGILGYEGNVIWRTG